MKPLAVVDDGGWTGGQKALAAIAVILLLTALGLVGYLVSQMNTDQTVTLSTTVVHQSPATTTTTTKTTSRTPRSTARTHHDDRRRYDDHCAADDHAPPGAAAHPASRGTSCLTRVRPPPSGPCSGFLASRRLTA